MHDRSLRSVFSMYFVASVQYMEELLWSKWLAAELWHVFANRGCSMTMSQGTLISGIWCLVYSSNTKYLLFVYPSISSCGIRARSRELLSFFSHARIHLGNWKLS